MKSRAFTLIELLVVVLIIGILAAVALPQYQVAVLKARYVELMALGNAIDTSERIYYMTNGEYTEDLDSLDLSIPGYDGSKNAYGKDYRCYVNKAYAELYCSLRATNEKLQYHIYFGGQGECWVQPDNNGNYSKIYEQVCKSLTGSSVASGVGWKIFRFN